MYKLKPTSITVTDDGETTMHYETDLMVALAGNSIHQCDVGAVELQSITVHCPADNSYQLVVVKHDGPASIYTDTGFEEAIGMLVGFPVKFTELGMQSDGEAVLEDIL